MNPLLVLALIVACALAVVGLLALGILLFVAEERAPHNVIDINSRRGK